MDTLDFQPTFNTVAHVVKSAADKQKDSCEFIVELGPQESGPPAHRHPKQYEAYKVLEGEAQFMLNGKWRTFKAGETAEIPANTPHTFKNTTSSWVKMHNIHTPALSFEEMMRELYGLVKSGKVKSNKDFKSLAHVSMLWVKHQEMQVSVSPPFLVMQILAGIGKLLGYKL